MNDMIRQSDKTKVLQKLQRLFSISGKGASSMAIIVKKLVKNAGFLYKMDLIAGKNGLTNLVQWVHIIEDDSVSSFLHGNELVFTGGILNKTNDWLLKFATKLYEAGASAFVVNIGPHTKEIHPEVIAYCDKVNMPLFTIPWETRMVDMTRDFCHRIMNNEQVENSMSATIKNIIFNIGDIEAQTHQMERYGYQRNSRFCFIGISIDHKDATVLEEYMNAMEMSAEKIARRIKELFISFSYKGCLVLVLVDYTDDEIESFVQDYLRIVRSIKTRGEFYLGISSNQQGIYNQDKNFEKAFSAMEMAKNRKETLVFYDRLDIYKVLYAVNEKSVLRGFYNDTIGKLEKYDREYNSELMILLKTYLENNGSLQLVSEKLFVHRNTVTNQLKKIEKVTGYNPMELEDKVMLYLGFYIKDII